jgi:NFU1 iron-sulfur cluster scaffold homolog, mitochondrial
MPFTVLEIQSTPNPNAMKFVLDASISDTTLSFLNETAAAGYPLARQLFAIPGVTSLLFLGDFITVNKSPDAKWKPITTAVTKAISSALPL